jgi:superfamily II DNA or RNA helicase
MRTLQDLLTNISFFDLPPSWQDHDLKNFASTKKLWDYQQETLRFAIRALWKYYQDFLDFTEGESEDSNNKRKDLLWKWYRENGLQENLSIPLEKRDVRTLLENYFTTQDNHIPYSNFINRMGFWMATGSGKSLVLIKLIEILWRLMRLKEIPPFPILVLTARDDLLMQLKAHISEFNSARKDFKIFLEDLKSYPDRQRMFIPLIGEREITIFFYRSDNLSNEQKDRVIDFRNYENNGHWYVLLDEAHKGDREDSKRQHIYSILSRNGFLFNFSATFTDQRDILTTVYNFNLSEFVRSGYGKHIAILKQENRAFRDNEDYTWLEKQRVVLKTLLMLAYVCKVRATLPDNLEAYHRPLMIALVNSVNTKDADLKVFFRELVRIGKGELDPSVWEQAKSELWEELDNKPEWLFENQSFQADPALFNSITPKELLRFVYNAQAPGEIEVLLRPSNHQEMAFKLKSAEQPFALIKIGDISGWLRDKDELEGYQIIEGYENEGFFLRLNEEDSPINILMGSRTFYEGWDSNRPNVITYINIGVGAEAKKFILQSVGRGVRIEPLRGMRRRLLSLYNANLGDEIPFQTLKDRSATLETLFIFGTNRQALHTVIEELNQKRKQKDEHELALEVNSKAVNRKPLLIPIYQSADHTILQDRNPRKFEIASEELNRLKQYVEYVVDPRLLVVKHNASPADIELLNQCLEKPENYFNTTNKRHYGVIEVLLPRIFAYFKVIPQVENGLKPLEEEIRHFRQIKVFLKDVTELKNKIIKVQETPQRIEEITAKFIAGEISQETLAKQLSYVSKEESLTHNDQTLRIKHVANHYYLPMLLSENERIDWIQHVIRHPSEIGFLKELENYLGQKENLFVRLDWWIFSRIDENLDKVYIPYYDPQSNSIRRFLPDFIFWMQQENKYAIVFVDPKGMVQTDYQYKIDGYQELFLNEAREPKVFKYDDLTIQIHLLLHTNDANTAPRLYRDYWFDNIEKIPQCITE